MTRKKIYASMCNSPLMHNIRKSNIQQLTAFRQEFEKQIQARKAATWNSLLSTALLSEICCFLVLLDTGAGMEQFAIVHSAGYVCCAVFWFFTDGIRFRRAAMMEKVITTLIDAAIQEKSMAAQASCAPRSTTAVPT